jgi:hypothetical protein
MARAEDGERLLSILIERQNLNRLNVKSATGAAFKVAQSKPVRVV